MTLGELSMPITDCDVFLEYSPVKEWHTAHRLHAPHYATQQSCFLQVRFVWTSRPSCLHRHKLNSFDLEFQVNQRAHRAVSLFPYTLLNRNPHMPGFPHWQEEADWRCARLLFMIVTMKFSSSSCSPASTPVSARALH